MKLKIFFLLSAISYQLSAFDSPAAIWTNYPFQSPHTNDTFLLASPASTNNYQMLWSDLLTWTETNAVRRIATSNFVTAAQTATQIAASNLVTAAQVATQIANSNLLTAAQVAIQIAASNLTSRADIGSSNFVNASQVALQIAASNLLTASQVAVQIAASNLLTASQVASQIASSNLQAALVNPVTNYYGLTLNLTNLTATNNSVATSTSTSSVPVVWITQTIGNTNLTSTNSTYGFTNIVIDLIDNVTGFAQTHYFISFRRNGVVQAALDRFGSFAMAGVKDNGSTALWNLTSGQGLQFGRNSGAIGLQGGAGAATGTMDSWFKNNGVGLWDGKSNVTYWGYSAATNGFRPQTRWIGFTNYTALVNDAVLITGATNNLITLFSCTNATATNLVITVINTNTFGSTTVTNVNGIQLLSGQLSQSLVGGIGKSTNSLTFFSDGVNYQ